MRQFPILIATFLFFLAAPSLRGQALIDTLIFRAVPVMDETLSEKSIMDEIPPEFVILHQSPELSSAFDAHISSNADRDITGYRVRIYFENKRDARAESEEIGKKFMMEFPGIMAYRSYQNPFFKVTVGDFRTRSEALSLLNRIKFSYPAAFIVKENINYPPVDSGKEVEFINPR